MQNRVYIIHTQKSTLIIKAQEAISNALEQKKNGIMPHYAYLYSNGETSAPGWLVWSTWMDGCGVVIRRNDNDFMILTGWQGDFVFK